MHSLNQSVWGAQPGVAFNRHAIEEEIAEPEAKCLLTRTRMRGCGSPTQVEGIECNFEEMTADKRPLNGKAF